jgi:hypothetical protein
MCLVVLRILLEPILILCTRFSLSMIGHSRPFHYQNRDLILESCNLPRLGNASLGMEPRGSHPPVSPQGFSPERDRAEHCRVEGFRLLPFRSPLLRQSPPPHQFYQPKLMINQLKLIRLVWGSIDLSSSPYLDVSVRVVPSHRFISASNKQQTTINLQQFVDCRLLAV